MLVRISNCIERSDRVGFALMEIQSMAPFISEKPRGIASPQNEYWIAIGLTVLVTVVSWPIEPITGHAAVALFYLLLVVVAGLRLGRGPVLLVAISGALLWDYLFNPPH